MYQRENGSAFLAGKFKVLKKKFNDTSEVCPLYVGHLPHSVGASPENVSPAYGALSSFGFALWLMPHVSSGWGVVGVSSDRCIRYF